MIERTKAMVQELVKLFSKGKLDQKDRQAAAEFGHILASLMFRRKNPEKIREINLHLRQSLDADNYLESNLSGRGVFYWVVTSLTHLCLAFFQEEEDDCFLLNYCLKNKLSPIIEVVRRDFPLLDDLKETIKNDAAIVAKLNEEGLDIDRVTSILIEAGIFNKYAKGNSRITLSLPGERLLDLLQWIEGFKRSPADLICELIKKDAIRSGNLLQK